ncbi:MAG: glycosyltransferase family 4 protein [Ignavibacteria bacterium]|jgi:glycosyltransferase involved in cell wall biosynthesis
MYNKINISFVSTYVPRQCGIGTFTNNLAESVNKLMNEDKLEDSRYVQIAALTNTPEGYKYGNEVKFEIKDQEINDYKEAAYYMNLSQIEVVNVQHEFGIFGGENGSNIIYLLENLKKPVVTTLHTVLEEPTEEQLKITNEILHFSSAMIVQAERAVKILKTVYRIQENKIIYIPHGVPDVPFMDPAYYKDNLQLSDRKVLLTFGLLSPGKGIEDVINSIPKIIKKHPEVIYIILGATHPNVKKSNGEAYRNYLENCVRKNSITDHVMFINRFVDNKELLEFLLMSDIYISPYQHKEQIVSGTLSYALACGKAIISTPYLHAIDIIGDGTGVLVPFKDPDAIAAAVTDLITSENKRIRFRKNAYDKGREMIWSKVASRYLDVFQRTREDYKKVTNLPIPKERFSAFPSLPEVKLNHMICLTDMTGGIFQHSKFAIPDRSEGYCSDDCARALLVSVLNRNIFNSDFLASYMNIYLSYILHAYNKDAGLFRNFMSYNRTWLEEVGSEESNSRVLFVLGYLIKNPPLESYLPLCKSLFDQALPHTLNFTSPRAIARILIGCIFYLSRFSGARDIAKICRTFASKISRLYINTSDQKWKWFEDVVAYSNGRLPQALLMAGTFFKHKEYITQGLESLQWLFDIQYDKRNNYLSLIGNNGWYKRGGEKANYDQQPVEIPGLIDACYQAYKITSDDAWMKRITVIFNWFLGHNIRGETLYDYSTGGCFDGLSSYYTNQNMGAESTLSWLISLHRMINIRRGLALK